MEAAHPSEIYFFLATRWATSDKVVFFPVRNGKFGQEWRIVDGMDRSGESWMQEALII